MNQKILIIEDDKAILKAYKDHLERIGYVVDFAENGEDGLKKIEEFKPDLVLLDIVMPKMDGITMLKNLRATNTENSNVPVIFLTNLSDDKSIMEAVESGSMSYLVKADHDLSDVVDRIKSVLG